MPGWAWGVIGYAAGVGTCVAAYVVLLAYTFTSGDQ
jgi:hypothetical protein